MSCPTSETPVWKRPESVLVVIHTPAFEVLLLERADHPGNWQSVTGSLESGETPAAAALRELAEETGFTACDGLLSDWRQQTVFEIFAHWRGRYAPGVTHNTEHTFSFCLPEARMPRLAPDEHLNGCWLTWQAAALRVFSWSNAAAIRALPLHSDHPCPKEPEP